MTTKKKANRPRLARSTVRVTSAERVRRHRSKQRASGLRLVQMWLPDTSDPAFLAAVRRECELINASADSQHVLDEMLSISDFSGWK